MGGPNLPSATCLVLSPCIVCNISYESASIDICSIIHVAERVLCVWLKLRNSGRVLLVLRLEHDQLLNNVTFPERVVEYWTRRKMIFECAKTESHGTIINKLSNQSNCNISRALRMLHVSEFNKSQLLLNQWRYV